MKDSRIRDLETAVVLSAFLLVLHYLFDKPFLIYISLILLIASLLFANLFSKFVHVWFKLGHFMGGITTKIIITFIFFAVLTPVSFLYRIFHRNPLILKRIKTSSYFTTRNYTYSPSDFKKNW
ncbi:MAG: hypothetical protein HZB61_08105 [Nitrospirae bacterium]|nr:hypothetical protein [Nitrospirota bacterium]